MTNNNPLNDNKIYGENLECAYYAIEFSLIV